MISIIIIIYLSLQGESMRMSFMIGRIIHCGKTKESVSFVKILPQIILRNVSRGLSKDGFAGSGIKLL